MPDTARGTLKFLGDLGWDGAADICWLDCSSPGLRKEWTDAKGVTREITLCPEDAAVLEDGAIDGDYRGAPLPADSLAGEWPWVLAGESVAGLGPATVLPTRGGRPSLSARWAGSGNEPAE